MVFTPDAVNFSTIEAVEGALTFHHILPEGTFESLAVGKP